MKLKKIIIATILMLVIISLNNICSAKYVFEYVKKAVYLDIDRTPPILEIQYSNKELINSDIQVRITANEQIQNIEGWMLLENGQTLIKNYTQNSQEKIVVSDLSGNITEATIQINNIDKNPPVAEIIDIDNTNTGYENYANQTHQITVKIKIFDNNKIIKNSEKFTILVGTKEYEITKEIKVIDEQENYIIYEIKLSNIVENGQLSIKIFQDNFEDIVGNIMNETILDTGIIIDNIAPTAQIQQNVQENGKILAVITSNEQIRHLNGWQIDSNNKIYSKEFISDIKYYRPVIDFAGNIQNVEIKIEGSTFLGLEIKAHMSSSGWTSSQINSNTIGRMEEGSYKYKFESLLFRTSKNVDDDYLRISGFINTYWGENSYGKSGQFGLIYNYGYNPTSGYRTMGNTELVEYEGKQYIPLAAEGVNYRLSTDIDGNNPIPIDIARQYLFGISGVKLDLKSHDENSIIYQIFFDDTGWLKTNKNGEEAMRAINQPIEAMRYAVIPTSESEFIISQWDEDIGTYNLR